MAPTPSAEQFWEVLDFSKIKWVVYWKTTTKQLYAEVAVHKTLNYWKLLKFCYFTF